MDITYLQRIKEQLDKNEEIGILVGKNPNLDDMAGALSLYLSFKSTGKKVSIASPTDPLVEISSLVGIDKVKTYLDTTGGDLIASFPYEEGEIEKVSYTLENGYLNIIVKAGQKGLNFSEKDIIYKRGAGIGPKTYFVVGTPRLSDLGNLFDAEAMKDTIIINIDNKVENQGFGDIVMVSPSFSSVSEQVANLLMFLDIAIDVDLAQNLLSGISFATDNFQNPKTSPLAFEMIATLLKKGATRQKNTRSVQTPPAQPLQGMQSQGILRPQSQSIGQQKTPFQRSALQFGQKDHSSQRDRSQYKSRTVPFTRPQPIQAITQQAPSMTKSIPVPQVPPSAKDEQPEEAPPDWLAPKVYKGSTIL